jgi:hypothetical protein
MRTRSAPEFGFGALRPRMRPRLVPALSAGTLPPQVIISIQRLQRALDRPEKGRFIVGPSLSNPSHGSGQMKSHPAAEVACPLAAIDQRLADAHRLWHQAEAAYFDPDGFRLPVAQRPERNLIPGREILLRQPEGAPDSLARPMSGLP